MSNFHSLLPRLLGRALCVALLSTSVAIAQDAKPKSKTRPAAEKDTAKKSKPPVEARDEETALKEFKADVKKIKAWAESQKDPEGDPVAGILKINEMAAKISEVRTDGLPEDLATPFQEMTDVVGKMAEMFKDVPADADEFQKWMIDKTTADPNFGKQLQEDMTKLGAKAEKAAKQLKEAGVKYGIKDLDFDKKKAGKSKDKDDDEKEEKDDDDDKKDADDAKEKDGKEK
jgi:hypothetical protein